MNNPYGVSRFRRAFVHFLGGRALQASARAALILILVRVLDIADYGVYMLLVGLSEMLLEVVSLGLLPVAQRYVPQMIIELPLNRLTQFVASLIVLQSLVLIATGFVLAHFWDTITPFLGFSAEQTEISRIAVLLLVVVPMFRFSAELLEGHLEQGKAQISRALMPTGRALVIVAILLLGIGIDLRLVLWIDIWVTVICLLLSWLLIAQSMRALHNPEASGRLPLRDMLQFGWHMAPVGMMGAAASPGALRMALASVLGVVESGLFAFLQSLQRLVGRYLPGTLLRGIIRPVLLSRAFQPGGMDVLEAGFTLLMKSNLMLVAAGCVVVAVGGNELVVALSGGKFENAGTALLIMFIALGVTSQRSIVDMMMQITDHTSVLRMTAVIAPIALYLVWQFAGYGLEVAIVIMALGSLAAISIAMYVLRRSTGRFAPEWRGISSIFLATLAGVASGIAAARFAHWVPAALLGGIVFLLAALLFKPYSPPELALVKRALGKRVAAGMRPFTRHAVSAGGHDDD